MIYERVRGQLRARRCFNGAIFSVVLETESHSGIEAWFVRRCSLSGDKMGSNWHRDLVCELAISHRQYETEISYTKCVDTKVLLGSGKYY